MREAAGSDEPLERVCPYRLEAPLSPERAAALEGLPLSLDRLLVACRAGVTPADFLLVEGAGGFCSPLAADGLNADLAVALGLPAVLVTADRLGAIHQALVTAEAIERRGPPWPASCSTAWQRAGKRAWITPPTSPVGWGGR